MPTIPIGIFSTTKRLLRRTNLGLHRPFGISANKTSQCSKRWTKVAVTGKQPRKACPFRLLSRLCSERTVWRLYCWTTMNCYRELQAKTMLLRQTMPKANSAACRTLVTTSFSVAPVMTPSTSKSPMLARTLAGRDTLRNFVLSCAIRIRRLLVRIRITPLSLPSVWKQPGGQRGPTRTLSFCERSPNAKRMQPLQHFLNPTCGYYPTAATETIIKMTELILESN
mmetsp:Transcript_14827/g.30724  ORF Transcript_14827/g.30724 Transcript_14827/m.30724 type:complete len:225 (+) Transcript_14827:410-1084(+)